MFPFWTPEYIRKSLRFSDVFRGSKKDALAQYVLTKPALYMYELHSLHGQCFGFHFLTSLLKGLIAIHFFISRGIMFQI